MNLSPLPIQKFFSNIGLPLVGGKLFTYAAGTSNKIATYTDSTGASLNTNPIILNFRGECRLWIDPTLAYKFVLSPPLDSDPPTNPIWTVDNITAGPAQRDNSAVDTGSVNNIALSIPLISSPVAFTRIVFKAANTNTGAVTISINGGTAKNLDWQNVGALAGGEIQANGIYEAIYDGAQWQLQGPTLQPPQIRTAKEIAAGIVPKNYAFLPGNVHRYASSTETDFTQAINDAYAATGAGGGGYIEFEARTYNFTTLTFDGALNLTLRGKSGGNVGNNGGGSGTDFANATVLKSTVTNDEAITFVGSSYNSKQIKITDMVIHAASSNPVLWFDNCSDITIENCMVVNDGASSGATSLRLSRSYYVFVKDSYFLKGQNQIFGSSIGVIMDMGGASSFLGGEFNFSNCSFQSYQTGFSIGDPNPSAANESYANINFRGCEFLANEIGIALQHGTKGAILHGCYFEANTSAGAFVTLGATGVCFQSCFLNNYSAAVADIRFGVGGGNAQYQEFYSCAVRECVFFAVKIAGIVASGITGAFVDVWNNSLTLGTSGAIGLTSNIAVLRQSNNRFVSFAAGNQVTGTTAPPLTTAGGTFTATLTGVTGSVTATAYYNQIGNQCTLFIPTLSGTSNATTCTITGLPAGIVPTRAQGIQRVYAVDNGVALSTGIVQMAVTGVIDCFPSDAFGGWTNANGKGIGAFNYTYLLI